MAYRILIAGPENSDERLDLYVARFDAGLIRSAPQKAIRDGLFLGQSADARKDPG